MSKRHEGEAGALQSSKGAETTVTLIPWKAWVDIVRPYYPKGRRGRPPQGIETMLRMYLLQTWFSLSDEAVEDAIYDSYAMRSFMGIDFATRQAPDATTLCKFRRLLTENGLQEKIFEDLNQRLEAAGIMMRGGSIVDATIISAPSSTKNATGERDPEMHSTKKNKQYYFGMKAHIGVDAGSGLVHSLTTTPANTSDIAETHKLIRDDDSFCYADAGYMGIEKRAEIVSDAHLSSIDWKVARRRSTLKGVPEWAPEREIERRKASVRSKVEQPFHVVKGIFGYAKTRYRGLAKNEAHLFMLFALSNLEMCACAGRTLCPV